MPDALIELVSLVLAAVIAGIVLLPFGWPWQQPRSKLLHLGWVLSVAISFCLAWFLRGGDGLMSWPKWPPADSQGRLLLLLLPILLVVEIIGAFGRYWYVWPLRMIVAFGTARLLLDGSVYLSTAEIPDDETWTATQTWGILGDLGSALLLAWGLLTLLARHVPSRTIPLALALTCAGSGIAIMISGYLSGGRMSLMLAYGLIGAVGASLLFRGRPDVAGSIGVPLVLLFSLLVSAHFFAGLTTTHAILLFFAPLLCWLPLLTSWPRTRPMVVCILCLMLVAIPIGITVMQAYQTIVAKSPPESEDSW